VSIIAASPDILGRGRRRRVNHDRVRTLHADRWTAERIAADQNCTAMYVRLIIKGATGDGVDQNLARFASKSLNGRAAPGMPAFDNPQIMAGRSLFRRTLVQPDAVTVFKSGHNSAKIGKQITKGKWRGFPIYTLTLEERATCPTSCKHWRSCYGNNMHMAQRIAHGAALETRIRAEVAVLCAQHPRGFAVRLHVLGDFYSVAYVEMWADLLAKHPQLRAFGFSARWDYHSDPIARALIDLVGEKWSRFAIRFSNAPLDACATRSVEHPYQIPDDAIWCPQQTGKTAACATCALCWQTTKNIAFVQH
jgi:hypothetical protein